MDGVMGSMAIIDQHLVGQGYRRYSNKVCLDNGNYSLVYVRSDIQISVSADSEGQASVTHYFHESLTAPQLGTIPEQKLLEIPAQCAAAN